MHSCHASKLKSHMVRKRHLQGCGLFIETKDEMSRRLYELEFYAAEGGF